MEIFKQAIQTAKTFNSMNDAQVAALLEKTKTAAMTRNFLNSKLIQNMTARRKIRNASAAFKKKINDYELQIKEAKLKFVIRFQMALAEIASVARVGS